MHYISYPLSCLSILQIKTGEKGRHDVDDRWYYVIKRLHIVFCGWREYMRNLDEIYKYL